ncbi:MAG: hypothetical protein LBH29_04255 [Elusimicrobiota bacterium]|nr:hypothetical protein [Elusimicrobiota bacterium]
MDCGFCFLLLFKMDSRAPRENDNDGKRQQGLRQRYAFAHAAMTPGHYYADKLLKSYLAAFYAAK